MIYLELFYVFFLIGLFTFGGGYAMIPLLQSEIVGRGWINIETFNNIIAISESTPGPIAINMATFVGNLRGGVLGSLLSTLGVILPSFLCILLVATILSKIFDKPIVKAILYGIKSCVIGLIFATAATFLYQNVLFTTSDSKIDIASILIFISIVVISIIYKKIKNKKISPYFIILYSGIIGLISFYLISLF